MGDNPGNNAPLVVNELLCYATCNMSRSTSEHLVKAIYRYYDNEELVDAKKLLYQKFPQLGEFPTRRPSTNRSEQEAHSIDIVESLVDLDSKGVKFMFVACNLNRIPKWDPCESDFLSIMDKLNKLECRITNTEYVVSENKAHIINIGDNVEKVTSRVDTCEKTVTTIAVNGSKSYATATANGSKNDTTELNKTVVNMALNNGQDKSKRFKPPFVRERTEPRGPHPLGILRANGGASGDGVADGKEGQAEDSDVLAVGSDAGDTESQAGSFVFPREQRKRKERQTRRRNIITGTAGTARFRGGPPPMRDYFLYRVMKPATEDDVSRCLHDNDIKFDSVVRISKPEARYRSFKLSISVTDIDKVMDAQIWPEGVRIRKFVSRTYQDNGY
jgi:hypothetical protein